MLQDLEHSSEPDFARNGRPKMTNEERDIIMKAATDRKRNDADKRDERAERAIKHAIKDLAELAKKIGNSYQNLRKGARKADSS